MAKLRFDIRHAPAALTAAMIEARKRGRGHVRTSSRWPVHLETIHLPGQGGVPVPLQTFKLPLPEHFNCSLIRWQGKWLLASRSGIPVAGIHLSILADDFDPITTWPLKIRIPGITFGMEDPRLFLWCGRLCVSFTGLETLGDRIEGRQCYAVLRDDLRVDRAWIIGMKDRQPWEKNWAFFTGGPALLAVYSVRPHVVVNVTAMYAKKIAAVDAAFPCPAAFFRGGAPPVLVGREWFHWIHTVARVNGNFLYATGLYTFADRPPFEPLRYLPVPAILPDRGDVPPGWKKAVSFPCGAVLDSYRWLVSYGYQDRECRIASFSAAEIDSRLVALPPVAECSPLITPT